MLALNVFGAAAMSRHGIRADRSAPQESLQISSFGSPAIDLVHLARQTDGDEALESELLAMFDQQSAKLVVRIRSSDSGRRLRSDLAHRLRGSALAVGAGRVASAAEAVELALAVEGAEPEAEIAELVAAVEAARAAIAALKA